MGIHLKSFGGMISEAVIFKIMGESWSKKENSVSEKNVIFS